jgi:D-sedoheptulose 7-phosphate isomerase
MTRRSKIFIIGNGGSASTASHMAVDLAKGTQVKGYPSLRVISLTDNVGMITAWANDLAYEEVFTEQLKNLLSYKDVLIAISASGNSPNILSAVRYAKSRGAATVGFIGFGGGKLKDLVDVDITVSSHNYGVVEDFHLTLNHIISQFIKQFRERREAWHLI